MPQEEREISVMHEEMRERSVMPEDGRRKRICIPEEEERERSVMPEDGRRKRICIPEEEERERSGMSEEEREKSGMPPEEREMSRILEEEKERSGMLEEEKERSGMPQKEREMSKMLVELREKSGIHEEEVRKRSGIHEEERRKSRKSEELSQRSAVFVQERGWNVTLKVKKHSSGKSMEDKWENDCIGGQYWIKSLLLFESDRISLESGGWLSDAHIYAVSKLLKKQYPHQNGLQSTILLANKLKWNSSNADFIQMMNVSGNHWVCVSNINCTPNSCNVYDSLSPNYPSSLITQVAAIMNSSKPHFTMHHTNVQMQCGAADCGLFAIAFATALCARQDPILLKFDQKIMRQHLKSCLENDMMSNFPICSRLRRCTKAIKCTKKVEIHCFCRLPWTKNFALFGDQAQCSVCHKWFHQECARIPLEAFTSTSYSWMCPTCINLK